MWCHLMRLFTRCLTTVSNTTQLEITKLPTVNLTATCVGNRNTNVDVSTSRQHKKVTKLKSIVLLPFYSSNPLLDLIYVHLLHGVLHALYTCIKFRQTRTCSAAFATGQMYSTCARGTVCFHYAAKHGFLASLSASNMKNVSNFCAKR